MVEYDKMYSQEDFYWGLKTNKLVIESINYLPKKAKVLDIGCGEGRNSFYLSKEGFRVTAIDKSIKGIKKLKKFSKENNMRIKAKLSEASKFIWRRKKFDGVYAINLLQFVPNDKIHSFVYRMKKITQYEGINVITAFIAESSQQKTKFVEKGRYLFDKGELKKLYSDWKIIFYEEKLGNWETHGQPKHRHYLVKLIAKKK